VAARPRAVAARVVRGRRPHHAHTPPPTTSNAPAAITHRGTVGVGAGAGAGGGAPGNAGARAPTGVSMPMGVGAPSPRSAPAGRSNGDVAVGLLAGRSASNRPLERSASRPRTAGSVTCSGPTTRARVGGAAREVAVERPAAAREQHLDRHEGRAALRVHEHQGRVGNVAARPSAPSASARRCAAGTRRPASASAGLRGEVLVEAQASGPVTAAYAPSAPAA
jgi:hypothetical protein